MKQVTTYYLIFFLLCLSIIPQLFAQDVSNKYELKEINNISYYPHNKELDSDLTQVNLILPKGVDNPPVFLWIGGGAWAYVNRHQEMDLCRKMAQQGIAVISVGHRLSPQLMTKNKNPEGIKHPEHVKDIAQAFKWVYENAAKYGYSQENIFVGGFSSGGHLSALLAMDKRYLTAVELSPKNIKAIIPVGGGYDIPSYKKSLIKEDPSYEQNHINPVFGETNEEHIDASPITYIDQLSTPMLVLSEGDTYEYSVVFEQKLTEQPFKDYQFFNAHSESHSSLWTNLSKNEFSIYRNMIVDYIKLRSQHVVKKAK